MFWEVPQEGDKRIVRKFAWLPVKAYCSDGFPHKVWLQDYWATQRYEHRYDGTVHWLAWVDQEAHLSKPVHKSTVET